MWNPSFKAFTEYWSFEPRLCQPYRAQTKGKVESGVKYFKGNFLPGRSFVDHVDLHEQLTEWTVTIADVRIHGTTHERPIDRFTQERAHLVPTASQPSFRLEARLTRIVPDDYLVSIDTNRYSVPFTLIGQSVDVLRRAGQLLIFHRGALVAEHAELHGRHQLHILPEHGPGASARTARRVHSTRPSLPTTSPALLERRQNGAAFGDQAEDARDECVRAGFRGVVALGPRAQEVAEKSVLEVQDFRGGA